MTTHRTKVRRETLSSRALIRVFSIAITFRNNSLSLLIAVYLNAWRSPAMKGCGSWISQPYPAFGQKREQ